MATYYFDFLYGDDSLNGTSEATARKTMPSNASSAGYVNGDTWLLKCGQIHNYSWSGTCFSVNRSITIGKYGVGDKPVVSGTNAGSGGKLFWLFSSNTTIADIAIKNVSGAFAIYAQSGIGGLRFRRLDIDGVRGGASNEDAINIGASGACTDVEITDCNIRNIANDGINANVSDRLLLQGNAISGTSLDTSNGDCIAVTAACANLVITENWLNHENKDTKQCIIQDGGAAGFTTITKNVILGYRMGGSTHTAVYVSTPCLISGNFIRSFRSGIYQNSSNDATIESNVIVQGNGSSGTGAIYGNPSANYTIRKNLIIRETSGEDSADAAIRITNSVATWVARDNIIVGFARGIARGAASQESNNSFWNCSTNVVDESLAVISANASDITTNPNLIDSSRPWLGIAASSPCIGAGTVSVGFDYYGKEIASPANIGPFQLWPSRSVVARSVTTRSAASRSVSTRRATAGA